ncbi:MAG TPA: hypothetical protein VGV38_15370 [Pyrinomonadaceae bacterium]|nr:hypothetical protein [Pyrinomonadaceae bacterium]
MKPLRLLLMFLSCAGLCAAQAGPDGNSPPGLVVLKLKSERTLAPHRNTDKSEFDASRGSTSDPDALNNPNLTAIRNRTTPTESFVYQYTAEVRNDGAKRIEGLVWEFVVTDPASGKETGRRRFYSLDKINAGAGKKLRGRSHLPPSATVSVADAGKAKNPANVERAEFRCVMYADGSFWRRPSVEESECLELKDERKMRSRMKNQ